jgi:hypothetical protein
MDILGVPVERASAIAALAVIASNVVVWIAERVWRRFRSPLNVHEVYASPVYSGTELQFELAQIWFVNRSSERFTTVSAQVMVEPAGARGSCLWAIGTPAGQVAQWQMIEPTTDIEANDLPHKLNVALRYPGETDAYLASLDNRQVHPDYRDPTHLIPPGAHDLRVHLRGGGIDAHVPRAPRQRIRSRARALDRRIPPAAHPAGVQG